MTPDANDPCVFALNRGYIENREVYCNPLYPYYLRLVEKYKSSPYANGIMNDHVEVNPKTDCLALTDNSIVSFIPMTNVQEKTNVVSYNLVPYNTVKKGFTVFQRGDLIWAKITPCMQNGKSCIVDKMPTEIGFGSTEFHVVRKRNNNVYMPFIWAILSNENVIKAAQATFSGSAGQQRISASFIENFPAVLPDYSMQVWLVAKLENKLQLLNNKFQQADELLAKIPNVIANECGIIVPEDYVNDICSAIRLKDVFSYITKRIDPKCYDKRFELIRKGIENSKHQKYLLKDLLINNISGEWGDDPENVDETTTKCLVLRATEIDNKQNISIDPNKVQYRAIQNKKLLSMDTQIGDILIEKSGGSKDQPVGRAIYVESLHYRGCPISYSNFLIKLKVDTSLVDPYYLFEFLRFSYSIGLTEVMQNQTNGIRNLIMDEFLNQSVIVPENNCDIGQKIKLIRNSAKNVQQEAEQEWSDAKAQFEKELLGE